MAVNRGTCTRYVWPVKFNANSEVALKFHPLIFTKNYERQYELITVVSNINASGQNSQRSDID